MQPAEFGFNVSKLLSLTNPMNKPQCAFLIRKYGAQRLSSKEASPEEQVLAPLRPQTLLPSEHVQLVASRALTQ
jgi:hypothetical protein